MARSSITAILGLDASGMKDGAKQAEGATAKLRDGINAVGKVAAAAFAAAAAAVVAFAASSLKEMMKFDKGMKEVFTLMPGMSGKAMKGMEKDALELSKKLGILPEEVVPALYQALSAGVPKENVFTFMETAGKAAIGGVTTLETAVDGISSVMNAYGAENISAQQTADAMFTAVKLGKTTFEQLSSSVAVVTPIAKAAGMSFQDVMAAVAALTAAGVPTSEAMTQISSAITSISAPTEKAEKVAKSLGINFEDLQKDMRKSGGILTVMEKLHKGTGGLPGPMKELMGRMEGAKAAMSLMADGGKKLGSSINELSSNAGASEESFKTMEQSWDQSFNKMKARFKSFQIEFGQMLEPILAAVIPIIDEIFTLIEDLPWDEFQASVKDLGDEIAEAFGGEGKGAIEDLVKIVFDFVMTLVELGKAIARVYKGLADVGVFKVVGAALSGLIGLLKMAFEGWQKIGAGLSGIAEAFGLAGSAASQAADQQVKAMEAVEKKRKEHNSERAKEKAKAKHEERFVSYVAKAKGMEQEAALEFLAMELGYKREEKFSVADMMTLFKSGDLAKMKGVNMGEDLGVIADAIAAVFAKEEEFVGLAKQQFLEMGLNMGHAAKMAKGLGVETNELLSFIGKGDLTLVEVMRGHFGRKETERILAMGQANAERVRKMQEYAEKSLGALAKMLEMSEAEMLEAYRAGRLRGPIVDIIRSKLAARNKIKRELSGMSAEEIAAEKKNLELAKKMRAEEEKKAKERAKELAAQKKTNAEGAKRFRDQTVNQRAAKKEHEELIKRQLEMGKGAGAGVGAGKLPTDLKGIVDQQVGLTKGATESLAKAVDGTFPDCIALCDDTIQKLTLATQFIAEKFNEPIPVTIVDDEVAVAPSKKGTPVRTVTERFAEKYFRDSSGKPLTGRALEEAQARALDKSKSQQAMADMAKQATKKGSIYAEVTNMGELRKALEKLAVGGIVGGKMEAVRATAKQVAEGLKGNAGFEDWVRNVRSWLPQFSEAEARLHAAKEAMKHEAYFVKKGGGLTEDMRAAKMVNVGGKKLSQMVKDIQGVGGKLGPEFYKNFAKSIQAEVYPAMRLGFKDGKVNWLGLEEGGREVQANQSVSTLNRILAQLKKGDTVDMNMSRQFGAWQSSAERKLGLGTERLKSVKFKALTEEEARKAVAAALSKDKNQKEMGALAKAGTTPGSIYVRDMVAAKGLKTIHRELELLQDFGIDTINHQLRWIMNSVDDEIALTKPRWEKLFKIATASHKLAYYQRDDILLATRKLGRLSQYSQRTADNMKGLSLLKNIDQKLGSIDRTVKGYFINQ